MLPVLLLVLVFISVGCNHGIELPANPNMTGGWSGQRAESWTTDLGPGAQTCGEVWSITGQSVAGYFGGGLTSTGPSGSCSYSSYVDGHVDQFGTITLEAPVSFGGCFLASGDLTFSGVVSARGGLIASRRYVMRCPSDRGLINVQMTEAYTMNKQ